MGPPTRAGGLPSRAGPRRHPGRWPSQKCRPWQPRNADPGLGAGAWGGAPASKEQAAAVAGRAIGPPRAARTPSEIPPGPDSRWDCLEPLTRAATLPNHRLLPRPSPPPLLDLCSCPPSLPFTAGVPRGQLTGIPSQPEVLPHPHCSTLHTPEPTHALGDATVRKKVPVLTARWGVLPEVTELSGHRAACDVNLDRGPLGQRSLPVRVHTHVPSDRALPQCHSCPRPSQPRDTLTSLGFS